MKIERIICYAALCLLFLSACNKKQQRDDKDTGIQEVLHPEDRVRADQAGDEEEETLTIIYGENKNHIEAYYDLPHIKEFYEWREISYSQPPELKFPEDLSQLTYEELRLLRNEVFARNGYLFKDAFLRGYFNRYKWYMPIFEVDSFKIILNRKERELVDRILAEETKRKDPLTISHDDLNLYNADLIVNSKQFQSFPEKIRKDLRKQNFSILDAERPMPFYVYDRNAYQFIPHYITTDLYLFILHKYFSRFIEKLDQNFMYPQLKTILSEIHKKLDNLNLKASTTSVDWAKTFTSIALYTLGDSLVSVPDALEEIFEEEKKNIDTETGYPTFILNNFVDYNELKPRGHYTKSEDLERYFKGFKWLSLNGFSLKDQESLTGMTLIAFIIRNDQDLFNQFKEYKLVMTKISGEEDNLSLSDMINAIDARNVEEAVSQDHVKQVRDKLDALQKEKIKKVFGDSFKTEERDIKRVYFLSGTYSFSGEIFSRLVHVDLDRSKRPFPRGLDIPAVFGNATAEDIILKEYKDDREWPDYTAKLKSLQDQFKWFNDWRLNYGFIGVKTALSASSESENYPDFMKTDAYDRKELSTTLASWTHIKHDLILYQEKPYAAEAGQGGGPPPPQHYSYVEPNLEFWDQALDLVSWLEGFTMYEPAYEYELRRIKNTGLKLRSVAQRQINGGKISDEEYRELHYIGGTIEYILLGLLETDHLPEREKSMAIIADVYVYNGKNLNVAVGHADDIHVLVPINGEYYVARGSVFSYYEFTGDILNDDEWREKVQLNNVPERPEWIRPLVNETKPLQGQMQYRYPGHGPF